MSDAQNDNLVENIFSQLSTDPKDSKKFMATFGGAAILLIVFLTSAVIYCVNPKEFGQFSGIVMTMVPAVTALCMGYIGGQAVVEYKANSVLQSVNEKDKPVVVAPVVAAPVLPVNSAPIPVVVENTKIDPVNTSETTQGATEPAPDKSNRPDQDV